MARSSTTDVEFQEILIVPGEISSTRGEIRERVPLTNGSVYNGSVTELRASAIGSKPIYNGRKSPVSGDKGSLDGQERWSLMILENDAPFPLSVPDANIRRYSRVAKESLPLLSRIYVCARVCIRARASRRRMFAALDTRFENVKAEKATLVPFNANSFVCWLKTIEIEYRDGNLGCLRVVFGVL